MTSIQPAFPSDLYPANHVREAAEDIDLHVIWRRKMLSPGGPVAAAKAQAAMCMAYLSTLNSTQTLPPNVKAHFWTGERNNKVLLEPFFGPQGTLIDIPHSLVARAPVQFHPASDLVALIDQIPDNSFRADARSLHDGPICSNVGAASDTHRILIGMLYRRPNSTAAAAMNVYADIDVIDHAKDWSIGALQTLDSFKNGQILSAQCANAAKRVQAMAATLQPRRLSDGPKNPFARSERGYACIRPGEAARPENDYLVMVAGHKDVRTVIDDTARRLHATRDRTDDFVDDSDTVMANMSAVHLFALALFHASCSGMSLPDLITEIENPVHQDNVKQLNATDFFRLAQKMHIAIQHEIDGLKAQHATSVALQPQENKPCKISYDAIHDQLAIKWRELCLMEIGHIASELTEYHVNKFSYAPQVAAKWEDPSITPRLSRFFQQLFGGVYRHTTQKSWLEDIIDPNWPCGKSDAEDLTIALTKPKFFHETFQQVLRTLPPETTNGTWIAKNPC